MGFNSGFKGLSSRNLLVSFLSDDAVFFCHLASYFETATFEELRMF